jgi:multidrug resistance efflux pump
MSGAKVHAVDRLADFEAAVRTFADKAKSAMSANQMEIRRTYDWLESQLNVWKAEIRRAEDAVIQAKTELARRRIIKFNDRPPDTTEQEKTLRKAQARLAHAEEKRDNTKRWLRQLPDAIEEYDGQAGPFNDMLEHDLVKMALFLEQKIAALEAYQHTSPSAGGTP